MTSAHAILVSEEQRDAIHALLKSQHDGAQQLQALHIAVAYDDAGDQTSIRWCLTHKQRVYLDDSDNCKERALISDPNLCRVVTAIVVPVEEDA